MSFILATRRTATAAFVAVALSLSATTGWAWDPGLSMMQSNFQNMNNTAMTNIQSSTFCSAYGHCRGSSGGSSSASTVAPRAQADLSLGRDPDITAIVEADILEGARQRDARSAAELEAVLASYNVVDLFAGAVAPFGLGAEKLDDAMAAYWVLIWLVANRTPAEPAHYPSPSAVRAVRDQLAAELTADPAIDALSPQERQLFGHALIYNYVLLVAAWEQASASGQEAAFIELASAWRSHGEQLLGVDPAALDLTSAGFSVRE